MKVKSISPWTGIFLITFAFQLFRKELVDSLIFGTATLIMLMQPILKVRKSTFPLIRISKRTLWGMTISLALLSGVIPRHHGLLAFIFIVLAFLLFFSLWGISEHRVKPDSLHTKSSWIWASLAFLIAIWELIALVLARVSGDDQRFPTISVIVVPNLESMATRLQFSGGWILIGYLIVRHWRAR